MQACTAFCAGLNGLVGSFLGNLILTALGMLFVWLKGRKDVTKALAPVIQRAELAEKKATDAHLSLANLTGLINGSIRPAAFIASQSLVPLEPPPLGTSSSQSGNFEPVTMPELHASTPKPRPSMPQPNLTDPTFPRPSQVPDVENEPTTRPERPSAKGR